MSKIKVVLAHLGNGSKELELDEGTKLSDALKGVDIKSCTVRVNNVDAKLTLELRDKDIITVTPEMKAGL